MRRIQGTRGRNPIVAAPPLPADVCYLIIDIIVKPLLDSRRRRKFVFTVLEDLELHREELRCKAALAAGARISRAWHYPFQYRLSKHLWLASSTQFANLASRSYMPNRLIVHGITVEPRGPGICNPAPYSCHRLVENLGEFTSAATLSLCGMAWIVHQGRNRLITHQHITRLALV